MRRIAIVTDSNSSISPQEAKHLGVFVIPMPFTIDGENYYEDINLTQEEFYKRLQNDSEIFTSQPSVGDVMTLWDDLLGSFDAIIHISMSSSLSKSYETAYMLSQYDEYIGKVFVVNNQRISVTQRQSILDAIELVNKGLEAKEIKEKLEEVKLESSIYISLDTLKYLCKGGRVTKSAAGFAKLLGIKPVLTIQGEKLDSFAKARGSKKAYAIMIEAIKNDIINRFNGKFEDIHLSLAYTSNKEEGLSLLEQLKIEIPNCIDYVARPLSLSVACHIGQNALGIAISKKI